MRVENRFTYSEPRFAAVRDPARSVTAAYQNAARGLDTLKEIVLLEFGMPNTSDVIHHLAHAMPPRFDVLGDILHQRHLMQEYPATPEYTKRPQTLDEVFSEMIDMLGAIEAALSDFIKACDKMALYPLARQAENMQIENSQSYEKILYAWAMYDEAESSPVSYDNWIMHLFNGPAKAEDD